MYVPLHEEWRQLGETLIININTCLFYFILATYILYRVCFILFYFSYLYSILCLFHCNTRACSSSTNFWFFHVSAVSTRQGEPDTNYRDPCGLEGFSGPDHISNIFVFLGSNHHLSTVPINPFWSSPSHSATKSQSFRFSVKIFNRSAFAGRGAEIWFVPGPELALGGPVFRRYKQTKFTTAIIPYLSWYCNCLYLKVVRQ